VNSEQRDALHNCVRYKWKPAKTMLLKIIEETRTAVNYTKELEEKCYELLSFILSSFTCECCLKWLNCHNPCVGCPIYEKTGKTSCSDTPFDKLSYYIDETIVVLPRNAYALNGILEIIEDEIAFIEDLLNEGG
jgi:hypothetical protein